MDIMPKWVDVVVVPMFSLVLAALLSAMLILAIGESPLEALKLMVEGAYYGDDSPVTKSKTYIIKMSPDNLKKVLPTIDKKYQAVVKNGAKKSADFVLKEYKIRFIETGKKSVKQLDAQVTAKQENASLWIIRRALKDKIRLDKILLRDKIEESD